MEKRQVLAVLQFSCSSQHQLQTIFLVNLGCTRIVVNGYNVCIRMQGFDAAHHTAAAYMVWQTAEWLGTYNVVYAFID